MVARFTHKNLVGHIWNTDATQQGYAPKLETQKFKHNNILQYKKSV